MTILTIPTGIRVKSSTFGLESNTQNFVSPLNRGTQTLELAGSRWQASYVLTVATRDEIANMQVFLLKLRGGSGRFYAFDPDATISRGIATGSPQVMGASQTGNTVITDGWTPNTIGILKAGDYIQINDELKMITTDINSDTGGVATLTFEPPLRQTLVDNTTIITSNASCIMRLVDDSQSLWNTDEKSLYELSFSGVEVFA